MEFIELTIKVAAEQADILIAELAELGYDTFVEQEEGLQAYILKEHFETQAVADLQKQYAEQFEFVWEWQEIEKVNWNETWEQNYQPIFIGDQCVVHASFHQIEANYPYRILINPKMSFGTGHHDTTSLMMQHQLLINHKGSSLLDVGCGTGILAIFGGMLGASHIEALDTDEWAVANSLENIALNNLSPFPVYQGTIRSVSLQKTEYGIILANINRNVLIDEVPLYTKLLASKGHLLLSGFYEADIAALEAVALPLGLQLVGQKVQNQWASLIFQKI
jgi:ribosomal protein L11 methyltransferase